MSENGGPFDRAEGEGVGDEQSRPLEPQDDDARSRLQHDDAGRRPFRDDDEQSRSRDDDEGLWPFRGIDERSRSRSDEGSDPQDGQDR